MRKVENVGCGTRIWVKKANLREPLAAGSKMMMLTIPYAVKHTQKTGVRSRIAKGCV
jgi:hypothetical protein